MLKVMKDITINLQIYGAILFIYVSNIFFYFSFNDSILCTLSLDVFLNPRPF
jgi:hypothetical protein